MVVDSTNRFLLNFGSGTAQPRWGAGFINFASDVEYLFCAHDKRLDFSTEAFSVALKFRANVGDELEFIVNKNYGGTGVKWWGVGLNSGISSDAGKIRMMVDDGATLSSVPSTSAGYVDGNWHSGVFVRNVLNNTLDLYGDGVPDNGGADNTGSVSNTGSFYIGTRADLSSIRDFTGDLEYLYLYRKVLLPSAIMQLHINPYCMFDVPQAPIWYSPAPPVGAIMNQFQRTNMGADLYNGVFA